MQVWDIFIPFLSLYTTGTIGGNSVEKLIFSKRWYILLVELSPYVLEKAARVEISYVQN